MTLPADARNALLIATLRLLLSRELAYWTEQVDYPARFLFLALEDSEYRAGAARALVVLLDLGVLDLWGVRPDSPSEETLRSLSERFESAPWFTRFLSRFEPWASGEDVTSSIAAADIPITPHGQQEVADSEDRTP